MIVNTAISDKNADFGRGLFVCEKPGIEFLGAGAVGAGGSLILSQGVAVLFMIPVLSFFVLRDFTGVSVWVAVVVAVISGSVVLIGGLMILMRMTNWSRNRGGTGVYKKQTDSRYRIRAVIPKKRQESEMIRWAHLTARSAISTNEDSDEEDFSADELEAVRGGFEPMIIRPWFGIRRSRSYWWTGAAMGIVVVTGVLIGLGLVFGGWRGVLDVTGLMGYALIALGMVSGMYCSELIWPVYIRLVPGQLDIFRYGFLGSGEPKVERFDLRRVGVCVDFGGYIISLEPAREVGEPLPELVGVNGMIYRKEFPKDYQPMYFAVSLVRDRREFAQRLIQAARTDEPTPPVSMDRLGE